MADIFDENESENRDDESFAEMFELFGSEITQEIRQGDRIDGKIIAIGESSVYIDTGSKSDGVVDKIELLDENGEFQFSVGDTVGLYVVSLSESEIILSKALSGAGSASMLEEASYNRTPVEGKVSGTIKGGFSVDIMGKRAFCPVSQMDVKYVETPEDYVGGVYNFIITRFAEGGRNIVVSRRDLLNVELKEKRQQFFEEVSEGDTLQGHVTKLMPYGAFIELIPGVEGMAHISELSWSRVEKPEEALTQGEAVSVKILKIETKEGSDTPKISLSLKQTESDPWSMAGDNIHTGDQLTGKVMRLAPFGAFVEIAPGLEGLVHLSEMSYTKRILKADDVVSQGEMVQVVVKEIDIEKKRISLSIRDAHGEDPWAGVTEKYKPGTFVDGVIEKREKFGLFITLEPGVTGLLPGSGISRSSNPSEFDKLKHGDTVNVMVEAVEEERRRITLAPKDLKDGDSWKQFAKPEKAPMGTMGELLMKAMKKNK